MFLRTLTKNIFPIFQSPFSSRLLRRYRHCWKIDRFFAWLQNFCRLVVRYKFHSENFLAMTQLGCIVILLRLIMR